METKKNIIKEGYANSYNLLKKSKIYIIGISFAILFSALIGYLLPQLFEEEVFAIIKQILSQIDGKTGLDLITYIFTNNVRASFFAVIFGIIFGVFPLLSGILNGYVIGFSAQLAVKESGKLVLLKLLPHGIFEIPAIVISMGIGFYLGTRFLERHLKVKSELKRIILVFLITIFFVPLAAVYYLLTKIILDLQNITFTALSPTQFSLILLVFITNIILIILAILIFYYFMKDKELKKDLYDSLIFFILIILPLLLVAGIIEGLLIGFFS